jgi:hypothetical protein
MNYLLRDLMYCMINNNDSIKLIKDVIYEPSESINQTDLEKIMILKIFIQNLLSDFNLFLSDKEISATKVDEIFTNVRVCVSLTLGERKNAEPSYLMKVSSSEGKVFSSWSYIDESDKEEITKKLRTWIRILEKVINQDFLGKRENEELSLFIDRYNKLFKDIKNKLLNTSISIN